MVKKDLSALKIDPSRRPTADRGGGGWMVVSLLLLLVLGGVIVYLLFWDRPSETAADPVRPPSNADATRRTDARRDDREMLIVSGYIVAHHKIQLGSKVLGKVVWIGVDKGDQVTKDQLLVRLDDREYRAQLQEARAALQAAAARLAELEAGSRPEEIDRARAEVERIRADLENSRLELDRARSLQEAGVTPRQTVDSAEVRVRMTAENLRSAERALELLELGPRTEQIEQGRAEVERARAVVAYRETMLEATEIRAPITGTVLERLAEVGELVTTSLGGTGGARTAVVALADLEDLRVELDISQADFRLISQSEGCRMTPEAYPDRTYPCEIAEISPEANRQKATIEVKVRVLEPDEYLRPEMSARVTFLRKPEEDRSATAGTEAGVQAP